MAEPKRSGNPKGDASNSDTGNNRNNGNPAGRPQGRNNSAGKRVYASNARDLRNAGKSADARDGSGNGVRGTKASGRTAGNTTKTGAGSNSQAGTGKRTGNGRTSVNGRTSGNGRSSDNSRTSGSPSAAVTKSNTVSGRGRQASSGRQASAGKTSTAGRQTSAGKKVSNGRNASDGNTAKAASNRRNSVAASKSEKYEEYLKMTPDRDDSMKDEIGLVVAGLFCILLVLSYLKLCAGFGDIVNKVVFGLFGSFGYAFPFVLFTVILFAISNKRNVSIVSKTIYCFLIMIDISAIVQLLGGGFDKTLKFTDYFSNSLPGYAGPDKTYGGILGGGLCKVLCPFLGKIGTGCVLFAGLIILLILILGKAILTAITRRSLQGISNIRERNRARREEQAREYEEMLRRGESDGYYGEDYEPGYEEDDSCDDDYDPEDDAEDQDFEFPEHLMTSGCAARNSTGYSDAARRRYLNKLRKEARKKQKEAGDSFLSRLLGKYKNGTGHIEDTPEYKEFKEKYGVSDYEMGELIADALQKTSRRIGTEEDYTEDDFSDRDGFVEDTASGETASEELISPKEITSSESRNRSGSAESMREEEKDIVSRELDRKFGETPKVQNDDMRGHDRPLEEKHRHYFVDEDPDSFDFMDQSELDEELKKQVERFYDEDYPKSPDNVQEGSAGENVKDTGHAPENGSAGKHKNDSGYMIESGFGAEYGLRPGNTAENETDDIPENDKDSAGDHSPDVTGGDAGQNTENAGNITTYRSRDTNDAVNAGTGEKRTDDAKDRDASGAVGFNTPEQIKKVMEAAEEKKKNPPYEFPPYDLLKKNERSKNVDHSELDEMVHKLQASLESFGVRVRVGDAICGPTVTRYEVYPEQGVKVKNITALTDDIKLALAVPDIRIEAPIPGKAAVGIEVPNKTRTPVSLRELIDSDEFRNLPSKLTCAIGKDIGGKIICADIAAMPHALVAGSTGSGKSVCINSMILSILYKAKPSEVRLILIDPKRVELVGYNGIPHLLVPVVTDVKKATGALNWAVAEMDDRYNRFADVGVSNLASYNRLMEEKYYEEGGTEEECPDRLPQILIIIDEFCDLMMTGNPKEVEAAVGRLTQLARACGIHLVIATQRPAVNVITGTIKANIPSRISFSLTSVVDSRTILDQAGAEKLLGKGDMLFSPQEYPQPVRLQGAYVSDKEIADVVKFVKDRCKENMYSDDVSKKIEQSATQDNKGQNGGYDQSSKPGENDDYRDELFAEAGKLIIRNKKASIGSIQRAYRLGFNRAARIMDQLAEEGVVGPDEGTKPRQILMTIEQFEAMLAGEEAGENSENDAGTAE